MPAVVFLIFASLAVISALAVITCKNIVHSAFSLVATLFFVGCIFILLHAEFLAATQIIIYVGAIMILVIFALLLINIKQAHQEKQFHRQAGWVIGCGALLIFEIVWFVIPRSIFKSNPAKLIAETKAWGGNTQILGHYLFTDFLLAFELASLVLLIAIIAAIYLGKTPPSATENTTNITPHKETSL